MRTLTPGEVEVLFENAQDNYYYPVIYTAVSTGLRQAYVTTRGKAKGNI